MSISPPSPDEFRKTITKKIKISKRIKKTDLFGGGKLTIVLKG